MFMLLSIIICSLRYVQSMSEHDFEGFYTGYENEYTTVYSKCAYALWDYYMDLDHDNKSKMYENALVELNQLKDKHWKATIQNIKEEDFGGDLKRLAHYVIEDAKPGLSDDKFGQLTSIITSMTQMWLNYDPQCEGFCYGYYGALVLWENSRKLGLKAKDSFKKYVELSNEYAKAKGYDDYGKMLISSYEYDQFPSLDSLWEMLKPLSEKVYQYMKQVFAYKKYTDKRDKIVNSTLIPIHLFSDLFDAFYTYRPHGSWRADDPSENSLKDFSFMKMFDVVNDFLKSLGLKDISFAYDRSHGSQVDGDNSWTGKRKYCSLPDAVDFGDGRSYRIRLCPHKDFSIMRQITELMSKIEYFVQYRRNRFHFRNEPIKGFHDAVGGAIALSASSLHYLSSVNAMALNHETFDGGMNGYTADNVAMWHAIHNVHYLSEFIVLDKWRLDVFGGQPEEDWDERYWEYAAKYQYSMPPKKRLEKSIDPLSFHIVLANTFGMPNVVAFILKFQIFKSLCITAGKYDANKTDEFPLLNCDFSGSKEVGNKLKDGMILGSEGSWQDALEAITGTRSLDNGAAMMEFFGPALRHINKTIMERTSLFLNMFILFLHYLHILFTYIL